MKTRPFETGDMNRVISLANTYAEFDGPMQEADFAPSAYFPDGLIVAVEYDDIIGAIYGYLKEIPSHVLAKWGVEQVGHIELLVVHPDHRNKGVGEALLKQLLEVFRANGVGMVTLDCPADAIEARRLYGRLGFLDRAYHMSKTLWPLHNCTEGSHETQLSS